MSKNRLADSLIILAGVLSIAVALFAPDFSSVNVRVMLGCSGIAWILLAFQGEPK